jgi:hypothetical protein
MEVDKKTLEVTRKKTYYHVLLIVWVSESAVFAAAKPLLWNISAPL